jgi:hypothetical protein
VGAAAPSPASQLERPLVHRIDGHDRAVVERHDTAGLDEPVPPGAVRLALVVLDLRGRRT